MGVGEPSGTNRPMRLNTGYIIADTVMKRSACHRQLEAGEVVFAEGDPASGLYVVLTGRIEIIKPGPDGSELRLAEVGPDGVFGEMGLIVESGTRSATARAMEPAQVLMVPNNPIQTLREMGEIGGTVQLLKHVICRLAEWLRAKNEAPADGSQRTGDEAARTAAAEVIRSHLPRQFLGLYTPRTRLEDGGYLCQEGDRPDGFYFIHSGTLQVLRREAAEPIGELQGPTVVGEVGYFSGERRLVSLRASGEVVYSAFSAEAFEELEENHPEKAIEVLIAAARSIVALVD